MASGVFSSVQRLACDTEDIKGKRSEVREHFVFCGGDIDSMFAPTLVSLFLFGAMCRAQFLTQTAQQFPQGFSQILRFHQPPQQQQQPEPTPAGRILQPPVPHLCMNRQIHETFGGKGYWFSWRDSSNNKERDWLDGRNFCRQRCMDLVSLETSVENEFIKQRVVEGQQKYIWTSGRLCDFKGCEEREDLKPIAVNGWFWSGELRKLAPVTNRLQNDWSASGGISKPQPDNREFVQGGAPETCLAILNNFYGDGVHWHDVACHHRKPIVCEDSDALLRYVRYTNPGMRV